MTKVFVQQPWLISILNNNGAGKTIRKEKGIKKSFKNFYKLSKMYLTKLSRGFCE